MRQMRGGAFVAVLILIAVLTLGGVGYFFRQNQTLKSQLNSSSSNQPSSPSNYSPFKPSSNTPPPPPTPADETANWKTYTNMKYGYSSKYPPNWTLADQGASGESGMILQTKDLKFKDYSNVESGAFIYEPYTSQVVVNAKSLSDLFAQVNQSSIGQKVILEEVNTDLDGQPAKKRVLSKNNAAEVQLVFQYPKKAQSGGDFSFLTLISAVKGFDASKKTFDQILSTFKFLD